MNSTLLIVVMVVLVGIVLTGLVYLFLFSNDTRKVNNIGGGGLPGRASRPAPGSVLKNTAVMSGAQKRTSPKLTLRKRLKFGQLNVSPPVVHAVTIGISLFSFSIFNGLGLSLFVSAFSLLIGPIAVNSFVNYMVERRFKAFDSDYAPFLMSVVGLLKTGMNPMSALEAAAGGLAPSSLLRQEIELMNERLRFGVPEERSIGAFGDDVLHPEIELFVQALLLSRRVGGTLSETLERLAKQVRKRQYFRASAKASVAMQRGSVYIIVAILVGLQIFMLIIYPQALLGAWANPAGKTVIQICVLGVLFGIYWARKVTNIKI